MTIPSPCSGPPGDSSEQAHSAWESAEVRSALPPARLDLQVRYPNAEAGVIRVRGEVDDANVQRFSSLLWQWLASPVSVVVLDMQAVSFLSVSAVDVVARAAQYAHIQDRELRLLVATSAVWSAVQAAGLQHGVPCYEHLTQALPEMLAPESPSSLTGQQDTDTTS